MFRYLVSVLMILTLNLKASPIYNIKIFFEENILKLSWDINNSYMLYKHDIFLSEQIGYKFPKKLIETNISKEATEWQSYKREKFFLGEFLNIDLKSINQYFSKKMVITPGEEITIGIKTYYTNRKTKKMETYQNIIQYPYSIEKYNINETRYNLELLEPDSGVIDGWLKYKITRKKNQYFFKIKESNELIIGAIKSNNRLIFFLKDHKVIIKDIKGISSYILPERIPFMGNKKLVENLTLTLIYTLIFIGSIYFFSNFNINEDRVYQYVLKKLGMEELFPSNSKIKMEYLSREESLKFIISFMEKNDFICLDSTVNEIYELTRGDLKLLKIICLVIINISDNKKQKKVIGGSITELKEKIFEINKMSMVIFWKDFCDENERNIMEKIENINELLDIMNDIVMKKNLL